MTATTFDAAGFLAERLATRLEPSARGWLEEAASEIARGVSAVRFASLLSLASRHVPSAPWSPTEGERAAAGAGVPGWNPERWDLREAARIRLVLARGDQTSESFASDLEEAFRYADEGELRALYKSLALLPGGDRFVWRAGEGCRSNIVPVFESVACDTPFPVRHLDDIAWHQLVIKALFIGAPLWRVWGLDGRLCEDLARMALDLADERRSAGRPVSPQLWLALGPHGGDRALTSLLAERDGGDRMGARAAELALARRESTDWTERGCDQATFREFDPREAR